MPQLKEKYLSSSDRWLFLLLDLNDLSSIKASAEAFIARETRLDVLVKNASVMFPLERSKTAQEYDLQFGTNMLGLFCSQNS